MSKLSTHNSDTQLTFLGQHRFMLLILGTIVISIGLVSLSIFIYNASGAALLDLSRPGYQSVSDKVDRTDPVSDYSSYGPINKDTVNEFSTLFDAQAKKAKAVDAFNGDPLNPEVLEFSDPATSTE